MRIGQILMGIALLATGTANAATIFAPTDADVNFLFGSLGGATLAMFDDSDQNYTGLNLGVDLPSIVGISGPVNANNDHLAANLNGSLTLTGSDQFILGLNVGGTWLADTSVVSQGANAFQVSFDNAGTLVTVDVSIVSAVPVPAAVWLFGSGLLGIAGIALRRS